MADPSVSTCFTTLGKAKQTLWPAKSEPPYAGIFWEGPPNITFIPSWPICQPHSPATSLLQALWYLLCRDVHDHGLTLSHIARPFLRLWKSSLGKAEDPCIGALAICILPRCHSEA